MSQSLSGKLIFRFLVTFFTIKTKKEFQNYVLYKNVQFPLLLKIEKNFKRK